MRSTQDLPSAPTPLARQLNGDLPTSKSPRDAFDLAKQAYRAGQRIDMQSLATDLGVSRATLFRWVGNRDQLTAEVLWFYAEHAWSAAVAAAAGSGVRRVVEIVEGFSALLIGDEAFRSYLSREPEAALRLLTTRASVIQQRMIQVATRELQDEVDAGHLDPPMEVADLAYVIVRLTESFVYADLITGDAPDTTKAVAAVGVLLGSSR